GNGRRSAARRGRGAIARAAPRRRDRDRRVPAPGLAQRCTARRCALGHGNSRRSGRGGSELAHGDGTPPGGAGGVPGAGGAHPVGPLAGGQGAPARHDRSFRWARGRRGAPRGGERRPDRDRARPRARPHGGAPRRGVRRRGIAPRPHRRRGLRTLLQRPGGAHRAATSRVRDDLRSSVDARGVRGGGRRRVRRPGGPGGPAPRAHRLRSFRRGRRVIRSLWAGLNLLVSTLVIGSAAIIAGVLRIQGNFYDWCARTWAAWILWASNTPVQVEGLEHVDPGRPQIFASNHVSWYDVFALAVAIPKRY